MLKSALRADALKKLIDLINYKCAFCVIISKIFELFDLIFI